MWTTHGLAFRCWSRSPLLAGDITSTTRRPEARQLARIPNLTSSRQRAFRLQHHHTRHPALTPSQSVLLPPTPRPLSSHRNAPARPRQSDGPYTKTR
ncbi:hypothetical protein B0T26DRAFT_178192 [Lasiosphaeria miniovina]|uniref:Uncharacterized protein n=1 Tax=Lasiosphaeria miniovina TaxID=1954250 RepID=A0AA40B6F5_9PEZI|nr:uncharacterized protein B0T26DRAFT_178192 [Lasiosphaeria miniovina]KAK0728594.1 hypothetical protein B0T26DRAFT_178192 [Lasiosphaeria miniovina]